MALPDGTRRSLGDFEIVREIGRGGMGVVYEATQVSLHRKVALKVLSGGLGLTATAVRRFRREAEAAASLHHTNIVPVYTTGEQDGTHFYAMELVDGPSLDLVIRQARQQDTGAPALVAADAGASSQEGGLPSQLAATVAHVKGPDSPSPSPAGLSSSSLTSDGHDFDDVARMVAEVADALEYAHKSGVVHRDIKPSNLLLSPDGRLSVNDFGLARMLEEPGMTMTGEFVGTPAYMSPEQITAGRTPLDHRTDIYSLGATLYELLTLQPPFPGQRRDQVLAQILHKEPRPPRKLNKKVPADLETICLKALEKDPDRRYQTAGAVAEDLRRYVNRFAIAARRAGPLERLRKWARRRPGLAAALAGLVAVMLVAGFFADQARRAMEKGFAERRQNALDKALLLTMAADFRGAEQAIEEAERLDASTGQLRMLKGQIALFSNEYHVAIIHLEQAVILEPESVSTRALLAMAYLYGGQIDDFERTMTEVERLSPRTPEDYLFKGRAEVFRDRERGLRTLDEAVHRRPSPLAYVVRSGARADVANDLADPVAAELAIEDATFTKTLMPDNPFALETSAYVHLAAAGAFRATHQHEKARAARDQGERDARALERWVDRAPEVAFNCAFYLQLLNHEGSAFDVLRRAAARRETTATVQALACSLYRRGQYAEAVAVLERFREGGRSDQQLDCYRAYNLVELPGGRERAMAVYREVAAARPRGLAAHYALTVLLLLGEKEKAAEGYRQELAYPDQRPAAFMGTPEFVLRFLEYGAEQRSAEELLAAAGPSRWSQCMAHYLIALRLLSRGERAGARDHFRKCLETDNFFAPEIWWSRAFLGRMEKDPAWPPWIPVKN